MKRRDSIKAIAVGAISAPALLQACKTEKKENKLTQKPSIDRMQEEAEYDKKLLSETFFSEHEMATLAVLVDIIIPADEISGSATDAKVPEFIEFIVKDKPNLQNPVRGGLKWMDVYCLKNFEKAFKDCSVEQQISLIDEIAYPAKAKADMKQGVAFFNTIRNLTASGFYTSEIGVKDVGYTGNTPTQWNGVPEEVLAQYGLSYSEKDLKDCISFDKQ